MRHIFPITFALLLAAGSAEANVTLSQTFTTASPIPDGNPVPTQYAGAFNQTGGNSPVLFVTVSLNVSGGYNGDLYAYLVAPNGSTVMLLNQPGSNLFGAAGNSMNIILADGTTDHGSIQNPGDGYLTGSYNAAGSLSTFNGSQANGSWSLFFADMNSGGGTSTLNGWSLNVTVVPEPVLVALAIFAAMLTAWAGLKWTWEKAERSRRIEAPAANS